MILQVSQIQNKKKEKQKQQQLKQIICHRGLFLPSLNKLYGKTTYV